MDIFKFTQEIFEMYCESKDMADFHNLQGKIEPLTFLNMTL